MVFWLRLFTWADPFEMIPEAAICGFKSLNGFQSLHWHGMMMDDSGCTMATILRLL